MTEYPPHAYLDYEQQRTQTIKELQERLERLERVVATLRRKVYNG